MQLVYSSLDLLLCRPSRGRPLEKTLSPVDRYRHVDRSLILAEKSSASLSLTMTSAEVADKYREGQSTTPGKFFTRINWRGRGEGGGNFSRRGAHNSVSFQQPCNRVQWCPGGVVGV